MKRTLTVLLAILFLGVARLASAETAIKLLDCQDLGEATDLLDQMDFQTSRSNGTCVITANVTMDQFKEALGNRIEYSQTQVRGEASGESRSTGFHRTSGESGSTTSHNEQGRNANEFLGQVVGDAAGKVVEKIGETKFGQSATGQFVEELLQDILQKK
jgi:hypothetical protein